MDRCYPFVRLDDSEKDCCTNCSKLYDPVNGIIRQTLLQWYDQVDCTNKNIKIVEAVVLVFEGLLNMNEMRISPLDDLSMCSECVHNIAELYCNYRQFMERSVQTSYFRKVFSKCMLWRPGPGTKSNTDYKRKSVAKSRDKKEVKVKQTDNDNNTAHKLIPTPIVTRNSCTMTIENDEPEAVGTEIDISTVELKEEPTDEFEDANIYEDNFPAENDETNDDDDDYILTNEEDFGNNECMDKASKIPIGPTRKMYNTDTYKIRSVHKIRTAGKVKRSANDNNTVHRQVPTPRVTRKSCKIEKCVPATSDTEIGPVKEEPLDGFEEEYNFDDNFPDDDDGYILPDKDLNPVQLANGKWFLPKIVKVMLKRYDDRNGIPLKTGAHEPLNVDTNYANEDEYVDPDYDPIEDLRRQKRICPSGKERQDEKQVVNRKYLNSLKKVLLKERENDKKDRLQDVITISDDEEKQIDNEIFTPGSESEEDENVPSSNENSPAPNECAICWDIFKDSEELKEHRKTHLSDESIGSIILEPAETTSMEDECAPILCENCAESCDGRESLREHMEMYHPEEMTYKCEFCAVDFADRSNFREHMISNHKEEKTNKCETCGESFASVAFLTGHINKVHLVHTVTVLPKIAVFHMCKKCNKGFPTEGFLKVHEKSAHPRGFICDVCGKCKTSYGALYSHKRSHTDERPHACNVCNKKFKTARVLRKHELIHSGIKDYVCEICSKSFYDLTRLNSHLKRHEIAAKKPAVDKPFKCNSCSKSFNFEKTLKQHMRTHTEVIRPFACKICNKTFKSNNSLKQHEILHTKPFACSICKKRFEIEDALVNHQCLNISEKNKPYKCNSCHMAFWTFALLDAHILRIHSRAQLHKCKVCPQKFVTLEELKYHEKIHKTANNVNVGNNENEGNEQFESKEDSDEDDCVVYL